MKTFGIAVFIVALLALSGAAFRWGEYTCCDAGSGPLPYQLAYPDMHPARFNGEGRIVLLLPEKPTDLR